MNKNWGIFYKADGLKASKYQGQEEQRLKNYPKLDTKGMWQWK